MLRKTIALVLGLSLILSMMPAAFTLYGDQTNVSNSELESSFEIIEPKVKLKKELYLRDNLLVSISLSKEFEDYQIPVEMNLYAVKEFVELADGFENSRTLEESLISPELLTQNVVFKDLSKINLIGLTSEKVSSVYNELNAYKVYLGNVSKISRENMIVLNEKIKLKAAKKNTEIVTSPLSKVDKTAASAVASNVKVVVKDKVLNEEKLKEFTSLYERSLKELDDVDVLIEKARQIYSSSFERRVEEPILVEKSGLVTHFKYTYEGIEAGQYRLEFVRKDNDVVLKTVDFSVNKKSQLTEEKIKEDITDSLDIIR